MTHHHRLICAVLALLLAPIAAQAADLCAANQPPDLRLTVRPSAMVQVSVSAPCAPNTRVVLHHAGLAVTLLTSDQGTLLVWLPALSPLALIDVSLPDGSTVQGTIAVPEVQTLIALGCNGRGRPGFAWNPHPTTNSARSVGWATLEQVCQCWPRFIHAPISPGWRVSACSCPCSQKIAAAAF